MNRALISNSKLSLFVVIFSFIACLTSVPGED